MPTLIAPKSPSLAEAKAILRRQRILNRLAIRNAYMAGCRRTGVLPNFYHFYLALNALTTDQIDQLLNLTPEQKAEAVRLLNTPDISEKLAVAAVSEG